MANMFFAGIPLEGSGSRPLDADLYGPEQQGVDQENLSATGNLNIGTVIQYDEHAQRYMNGGVLGNDRMDAMMLPLSQRPVTSFQADNQHHAPQSGDMSAAQNTTALSGPNFANFPTEAAPLAVQGIAPADSPDTPASVSSSRAMGSQSSSSTTTVNNPPPVITTSTSEDGTVVTNTYYNNYTTNTENHYSTTNSTTNTTTYNDSHDVIGGDVIIEISNVLNNTINNLTEILDIPTDLLTQIINLVNNTVNNLTDILNSGAPVNNLLAEVVNTVQNTVDTVNNLLEGIGGNIPILEPVLNIVQNTLDDVTNLLDGGLDGDLLGDVLDLAQGAVGQVNDLLDGLPLEGTPLAPAIDIVQDALGQIGGILDGSSNMGLLQTAVNVAEGVVNNVTDILDETPLAAVAGLVDGLADPLFIPLDSIAATGDDLVEDLLAGGNPVEALQDALGGITGALGGGNGMGLLQTVVNTAEGAVGNVTDALAANPALAPVAGVLDGVAGQLFNPLDTVAVTGDNLLADLAAGNDPVTALGNASGDLGGMLGGLAGNAPLLDANASILHMPFAEANENALINTDLNLLNAGGPVSASGNGLLDVEGSLLTDGNGDGLSAILNVTEVSDVILPGLAIPTPPDVNVPLPSADDIPILSQVMSPAQDLSAAMQEAAQNALDPAIALATLTQAPSAVAAVDVGLLFAGGSGIAGAPAPTPAPAPEVHIGSLLQGGLFGHH